MSCNCITYKCISRCNIYLAIMSCGSVGPTCTNVYYEVRYIHNNITYADADVAAARLSGEGRRRGTPKLALLVQLRQGL